VCRGKFYIRGIRGGLYVTRIISISCLYLCSRAHCADVFSRPGVINRLIGASLSDVRAAGPCWLTCLYEQSINQSIISKMG
jgi:hypothetical protein